MITLKTLESAVELENPRRVKKYILIYCSSGKIELLVDDTVLSLSAGELTTITSGQIHSLKSATEAKGSVLEFTLDFFCKDDKDIELIFQNGLFCHFGMNEVVAVNQAVIEALLTGIYEELLHQPFQYLTASHALIVLILVEINRSKIKRGDEIWKPNALFLKFLEAVRNNFEFNYSILQFSEMLGTTELKLNELAKLHAGKTAQSVVHGLTISEAKRLLRYENLSVKETAFKLGYKDPFYFSNFFKKHVAISPKAYQARYAL